MANLFTTPPSRHLKLVPQTPMPGESISSLVDRQAQLWGIRRRELAYQVAPIADGMVALRDLDACPKGDFLVIYAQKTSIDRNVLEWHRANRSEALIRVRERNAYCPICFREDVSAGHTPYFRLDWARIFLTHCRVHGCPLFQWPQISADGTRKLPHEWFMGAEEEEPRLPQFLSDLRLARDYVNGMQPRRSGLKEAWDTVRRFEARLYDLGAGMPNYRELNRDGRQIEWDILVGAANLRREAVKSSDSREGETDEQSSQDQKLMSSAPTMESATAARATWRNLRGGTRSLADRRAMMYHLSMLINW